MDYNCKAQRARRNVNEGQDSVEYPPELIENIDSHIISDVDHHTVEENTDLIIQADDLLVLRADWDSEDYSDYLEMERFSNRPTYTFVIETRRSFASLLRDHWDLGFIPVKCKLGRGDFSDDNFGIRIIIIKSYDLCECVDLVHVSNDFKPRFNRSMVVRGTCACDLFRVVDMIVTRSKLKERLVGIETNPGPCMSKFDHVVLLTECLRHGNDHERSAFDFGLLHVYFMLQNGDEVPLHILRDYICCLEYELENECCHYHLEFYLDMIDDFRLYVANNSVDEICEKQMDAVKDYVKGLLPKVPDVHVGLDQESKDFVVQTLEKAFKDLDSSVSKVPTSFTVQPDLIGGIATSWDTLMRAWADPEKKIVILSFFALSVMGIGAYFNSKLTVSIVGLLCIYLSATPLSRVGVYLMSRIVPTFFSDYEEQADVSASVIEEGVTILMECIVSTMSLVSIDYSKGIKNISREFTKGVKDQKDFGEMTEYFKTFFVRISTFLAELLQMDWLRLNRDTYPRLTVFAAEISEFGVKLAAEGRFLRNDYDRIIVIRRALESLYRTAPSGRNNDGYRREIDRCIKNLDPLIEKCKAAGLNQEGVQEPVGFMLVGPPGCGKSFNMAVIASMVTARLMTTKFLAGLITETRYHAFMENFDKEMYNYSRDKFWDTYNGHMVTLVDEVGQIKEKPGQEKSVYMDLISMLNTAIMKLRMSESGEKNRHTFCSELVICTSNSAKFTSDIIQSSEAFSRRFDGRTYCVVPKLQYCKDKVQREDGAWEVPDLTNVWCRRLDVSKVPPALYNNVSQRWEMEQIAEFVPWDGYRAIRASGPVLSLEEFSIKATEAVIANGDFHEKVTSYRDSVVKQTALKCAQDTLNNLRDAHFPNLGEVQERVELLEHLYKKDLDGMHYDRNVQFGIYDHIDHDFVPDAITGLAAPIEPVDTRVTAVEFAKNVPDVVLDFGDIPDIGVEFVNAGVVKQMDIDGRGHRPLNRAFVAPNVANFSSFRRDVFAKRRTGVAVQDSKDDEDERVLSSASIVHGIDATNPFIERRDALRKRNLDLYRLEATSYIEDLYDETNNGGYKEEHAIINDLLGIGDVEAAKAEWSALPFAEKVKCDPVANLVINLNRLRFSNETIIYVVSKTLSVLDVVENPGLYISLAYDHLAGMLTSTGARINRFITSVEQYVMQHPLVAAFGMGFAQMVGIYSCMLIFVMIINWWYKPTRKEPVRQFDEEPILSRLSWEERHSSELAKVVRNMYRIYVHYGYDPSDPESVGMCESLGSILFAGGNVAITLKHFGTCINERQAKYPDFPVQVWLKRYDQPGEKYDAKMLWSEITVFPQEEADKAIWVFKMGKLSPKANIVKKFPSRSNAKLVDLLYSEKLSGRFVVREKAGVTSYHSTPTEFRPVRCSAPHPNKELHDVIAMSGTTKVGDCGGIGVTTDRRLIDVGVHDLLIFYCHQAAVGGLPVGFRIWQEDFEGFSTGRIASISTEEVFDREMDEAWEEVNFLNGFYVQQKYTNENKPLPVHFPVVGKVEAFKQVNATAIRKSPLYGKWGKPTKFPSVISCSIDSSGNLSDPFYEARLNYCTGDAVVNLGALEQIRDYEIMYLKRVSHSVGEPRILSFDEAVLGVSSLNIPAIKRSTSPGYRHNLLKLQAGDMSPGKYYWFGSRADLEVDSVACGKLRASVDGLINRAIGGDRFYTTFMDCLKDERLVPGKAARLFCCCELDFLLICKMYLGHFAAYILSNKIFNGICVGINPYGPEWQVLYDRISSFGKDRCGAGDFKHYDKKLLVEFIHMFFDIVDDYYNNSTPQEHAVRFAIRCEFINSLHVAVINGEGYLYEWLGANTSGNFVTTIMNCVINILMILYVICDIIVPGGILSCGKQLPLEFIRSNCVIETYGDDNLLNFSPKLLVDQHLLTKHFMSALGMVYTDELKTGRDVYLRHVDELSFLSRGFQQRELDGKLVMCAPLKLVSVLEAPYWVRRGSSAKDLEQCLLTSIKELSLHGEVVFNQYAPRMIAEGDRLGMRIPVRSYEVALRMSRDLDYEFNL